MGATGGALPPLGRLTNSARSRQMSRRLRKLTIIERRWRDRFGEPPSLRTDPALMLKILEAEERKREPAPAQPS